MYPDWSFGQTVLEPNMLCYRFVGAREADSVEQGLAVDRLRAAA